jgi:hypothetical protein
MKLYSNPVNAVALTALVLVQVVFVMMVYGPIAAFLVEAFPARIRYASSPSQKFPGTVVWRVPSHQSRRVWRPQLKYLRGPGIPDRGRADHRSSKPDSPGPH